MMAFDVYKKYVNPEAEDKKVVRFGQLFVVVMVAIAVVLALVTFDPTSSDNFFLKIANQTSYIKPGLVVAFFWGILWRKTHPLAAVAVLLGSPLIGLFCDWFYAAVLSKSFWVRENLGAEIGFLYRVFAITVLGSGLIVVLSNILNKAYPSVKSTESMDLVIPFGGIGKALVQFGTLQLPMLILVFTQVISPQTAALPAALLTFGLFVWYWKKEDADTPIYQSDIFYAGLLTTAMVAFMYFFA
jgi:solute:Na+ symporter, SSS family